MSLADSSLTETERFQEGPSSLSREQSATLIELLERVHRVAGKKRRFHHEGRNLILKTPLTVENNDIRWSFQPASGTAEVGHLESIQGEQSQRLDFSGTGKRIVFTASRFFSKKEIGEMLSRIVGECLNEVEDEKLPEREKLLEAITGFIYKLTEAEEGSSQDWGNYPKAGDHPTLRERIGHTAEAVTQVFRRVTGRPNPKDQEIEGLKLRNKELEAEIAKGGRRTLLVGAA